MKNSEAASSSLTLSLFRVDNHVLGKTGDNDVPSVPSRPWLCELASRGPTDAAARLFLAAVREAFVVPEEFDGEDAPSCAMLFTYDALCDEALRFCGYTDPFHKEAFDDMVREGLRSALPWVRAVRGDFDVGFMINVLGACARNAALGSVPDGFSAGLEPLAAGGRHTPGIAAAVPALETVLFCLRTMGEFDCVGMTMDRQDNIADTVRAFVDLSSRTGALARHDVLTLQGFNEALYRMDVENIPSYSKLPSRVMAEYA